MLIIDFIFFCTGEQLNKEQFNGNVFRRVNWDPLFQTWNIKINDPLRATIARSATLIASREGGGGARAWTLHGNTRRYTRSDISTSIILLHKDLAFTTCTGDHVIPVGPIKTLRQKRRHDAWTRGTPPLPPAIMYPRNHSRDSSPRRGGGA